MNKKILFALTVALVAIAAVGTASAFDFSDLGSLFGAPKDQNVTIDGETFKIPAKFKEINNLSENGTVDDYGVLKTTKYVKSFSNNTNFINIHVYEVNGTNLTNDLINFNNGTSKDISGVKGYLYKDDNNTYTYTYSKGNKIIGIQSDKEALIGPVIA